MSIYTVTAAEVTVGEILIDEDHEAWYVDDVEQVESTRGPRVCASCCARSRTTASAQRATAFTRSSPSTLRTRRASRSKSHSGGPQHPPPSEHGVIPLYGHTLGKHPPACCHNVSTCTHPYTS